ncbi:hypothetical protein PR048_007574 [Dryococelus australis]|uniref:Uncharacterized protein n=1 Tax=Dryococelus australis TaxID=614101 RepID=A0ABQ9HUL4_9NEOP|nr:hypothetical protein PR048_007574 [Dryococelus australis]
MVALERPSVVAGVSGYKGVGETKGEGFQILPPCTGGNVEVKEKKNALKRLERMTFAFSQAIAAFPPSKSKAPLAFSPFTEAIRVQSPAETLLIFALGIVPDDAVGRPVSSGISRFPRPFILVLLQTHLNNLNGSQDLDVKSRPNLFTHSYVCHSRIQLSSPTPRSLQTSPLLATLVATSRFAGSSIRCIRTPRSHGCTILRTLDRRHGDPDQNILATITPEIGSARRPERTSFDRLIAAEAACFCKSPRNSRVTVDYLDTMSFALSSGICCKYYPKYSHHCRSSERGVCSGPYTTRSVAAVVSLCGLRKFPSPDRKEHIAQSSIPSPLPFRSLLSNRAFLQEFRLHPPPPQQIPSANQQPRPPRKSAHQYITAPNLVAGIYPPLSSPTSYYTLQPFTLAIAARVFATPTSLIPSSHNVEKHLQTIHGQLRSLLKALLKICSNVYSATTCKIVVCTREGRIPGIRSDRTPTMRGPDLVDSVFKEMERDASTSVRMVGCRTAIPKSEVRRTLQSVGRHLYHREETSNRLYEARSQNLTQPINEWLDLLEGKTTPFRLCFLTYSVVLACTVVANTGHNIFDHLFIAKSPMMRRLLHNTIPLFRTAELGLSSTIFLVYD